MGTCMSSQLDDDGAIVAPNPQTHPIKQSCPNRDETETGFDTTRHIDPDDSEGDEEGMDADAEDAAFSDLMHQMNKKNGSGAKKKKERRLQVDHCGGMSFAIPSGYKYQQYQRFDESGFYLIRKPPKNSAPPVAAVPAVEAAPVKGGKGGKGKGKGGGANVGEQKDPDDGPGLLTMDEELQEAMKLGAYGSFLVGMSTAELISTFDVPLKLSGVIYRPQGFTKHEQIKNGYSLLITQTYRALSTLGFVYGAGAAITGPVNNEAVLIVATAQSLEEAQTVVTDFCYSCQFDLYGHIDDEHPEIITQHMETAHYMLNHMDGENNNENADEEEEGKHEALVETVIAESEAWRMQEVSTNKTPYPDKGVITNTTAITNDCLEEYTDI